MRILALMAAAAALFAGPAMAAGYGEFNGNWRNDDPGTRDLMRLRIWIDGGGLNVRAWGQCHPRDCDWGTVQGVAYSYSPSVNPAAAATDVIATFNPGFAQTYLILTDRPGDRLSYSIYTRFNDGRRPYVARGSLRKQAFGWPEWPPDGPGGPGGWPPGGPGGSGGWMPGGPGNPGGPGGPGGPGWPPGGPGGAPVTHATGPLSVPQDHLLDLDEGSVTTDSTADIWFHAVNPYEMYLQPMNGARMWVGDGSNRNYAGCAAGGPYTTTPVSIGDLPAGTYVCVRTNGGRYSQFRIKGLSGGSPKTLTIGFTTWE